MIKLKFLTAVLLLFFLPSALKALTLDEEKKYGREVYAEIAKSAKANSDPYLSIYMGMIKHRLEASADLPFPIKLTVVHSPTLDAFATVGGYVYVTDGLIELCDKEDEIAGVLGHEFAHVGRRHLANRLEKEKYINWGTVAATLLSMLVPGAQAPLMVASIGAGQTLSMKYSREDEEDADRVGLATSEKAGYNGHGIAEFMKKLRTGGLDKMLPQYLLTHPYTEDRIAKVEKMSTRSSTSVDVSLFPYVVAREKIMGSPITAQNEEIWLKRYQKDPKDPLNIYGASLVYTAKGNSKEAFSILERIQSPYRSLFLGEFFVTNYRFKEAIEMLSGESHPVARFFLAKAYEGQGDLSRANEVLKELLPYAGTYPEIYQRVGMVAGRQGNQARGYEYLGRFYLESGKEATARNYLEKAVSKYGINSPEAGEILVLLETFGKRSPDKGNKK